MKKMVSLLIMIMMLAAPVTVLAAEYPDSAWTTESTYANQTVAKLKFGFRNTLLGWTKLFSIPSEGEGGFLKDVGTGLYHAIADSIGGAAQLLTFYLPTDFPQLPEGGV